MAKKLSKEQRALAALGISGGAPDADKVRRAYDALTQGAGESARDAQGAQSDSGESPWTYLKKGGLRALDTLTVPQAAVFTGIAKAAGKDVPWSAALGNFGRNEEGEDGLTQALESLGVSNRFAQLGIGIIADPLWFVGGGVIKAATSGGAVANAARAVDDVADLAAGASKMRKGVSDARKAALVRAYAPKTAQTGRKAAVVKSDAQQSALVRSFAGLGRTAPREVSDVQHSAAIRAFSAKPEVPRLFDEYTFAQALRGLSKRVDDVPTPAAVADELPTSTERIFLASRNFSGGQRTATLRGDRVLVNLSNSGSRAKWAVVHQDAMRAGEYGRTLRFSAHTNRPVGVEKVFSTKAAALRYADEVQGVKAVPKFNEAQKAALLRAFGAAKTGTKKAPMKYGKRREAALIRAFTQKAAPKAADGEKLRAALGTARKGLTKRQRAALVKAMTATTKGVKGPKQAEKAVKALERLSPARRTKIAKALGGKKPLKALDDTDPYAIDEFGLAKNLPGALKKLREALVKVETREKGSKLGVRLGTRKHGKMISLGINAPARKLRPGTLKGGLLAMKPVEKIAHRIRDAGLETQEGVSAAMIRMADQFGLTTTTADGLKAVDNAQASMIGVMRAGRSLNPKMGEKIEDFFRSIGLWEARHNQAIQAQDARYKLLEIDLPGGAADRFTDAIRKVETKKDDIARQIDAITSRADEFRKPSDLTKLSRLNEQLADAERELLAIKNRGPYTRQGLREEQYHERAEQFRKDVQLGLKTPGSGYKRGPNGEELLEEREMFDNPFSTITDEQFVDDMMKIGLDQDQARALTNVVSSELRAAGHEGFRTGNMKDLPEWDAFLLAGRREQAHVWEQVDRQIDELLELSQIPKESPLYRAVTTGEHGGPFARSRVGRDMVRAITVLKGVLTFVNPSHFTTNFMGDLFNRQINGTVRHLSPIDAVPKSTMWFLANAEAKQGHINQKILDQVFDIGGKQMTGQELLTMSRMVGLGRGYVGTDVAIMVDAFEKAGRGPREWYRWAQRMNIKRENAQRLGTWIRHMQAGDDPIMAGVKTLRVHFDYTQLTDFEKLTLRNVLLFYTWLKRNTILQGGGLVTRPGLYSAVADTQNHREVFPNEPTYYAEQMAIPTPWGNFSVGLPAADLTNYELSLKNFRQTVLGAVNPLIRVPVELSTNQKFFTGGRIQDYEGQLDPSLLAEAAQRLGLPVTETTAKAGGDKGAGIDPFLGHALSQFLGPQVATGQAITQPDFEGSRLSQAAGRFFGIRPQANRPEAFARAAKYIEAKKKADKTRKKNAQGD